MPYHVNYNNSTEIQIYTMNEKLTSNIRKKRKKPKLFMRMYDRKIKKITVVTKEVKFELRDNLQDHIYWIIFQHLSKFEVKVVLEDIMLKYKHNYEDLPITTVKLINSALIGTKGDKYM